mmetsp:Transcript_18460/g.36204  ORF Transcript_18460/g.36204 Transcript_18460/m.36204 type:complete len:236 (-) Transcript_18460:124-831(-)
MTSFASCFFSTQPGVFRKPPPAAPLLAGSLKYALNAESKSKWFLSMKSRAMNLDAPVTLVNCCTILCLSASLTFLPPSSAPGAPSAPPRRQAFLPLSKGDLNADPPLESSLVDCAAVPILVILTDNERALSRSCWSRLASLQISTMALALDRMPPPTSLPSSITRCSRHCWTFQRLRLMSSMIVSLPSFNSTSTSASVFWILRHFLSFFSFTRISQTKLIMTSQSAGSCELIAIP